eukprot:Colp12_sorted_trinity150504_noHs@26012
MSGVNEHTALLAGSGQERAKAGLTLQLAGATAAAVLGSSFQFGYNTGVINNVKDVVQTHFANEGKPISTIQWAIVVSAFAIGGLVSGSTGGLIAERFGRKKTMLLNNLTVLLAAGLTCFATHVGMLIAGRFVVGLASGMATVVVPMYLSEIAPVHLRGGFGTLNQLLVTIGIVVSQVLGFDSVLGTDSGWRYLFGVGVAASIYQVLTFPFFPESPIWLYRKGRESEAVDAVTRLRGVGADISGDLAELKASQANRKEDDDHMTVGELFSSRLWRRPLIIGLGVQVVQQLSGINAVFYFSNSIFTDAKVSNPDIATALVGVVNVLCTLVCVWLMDKAGRRTLLMWGVGMMSVFYLLLSFTFIYRTASDAMSYISIVAVMLLVFSFAIGPGAIPWLLIAEIFPSHGRGLAMGFAVATNWFANFLIGVSFESLKDALGDYVFLPFVALCVLFALFVYTLVPETKGKNDSEIQAVFHAIAERGNSNNRSFA